jgi:hypothetical protein|tara:strand:- start:167 stop:310 length:144 start_codon:yes stop_codon:yes gene_type:complete
MGKKKQIKKKVGKKPGKNPSRSPSNKSKESKVKKLIALRGKSSKKKK